MRARDATHGHDHSFGGAADFKNHSDSGNHFNFKAPTGKNPKSKESHITPPHVKTPRKGGGRRKGGSIPAEVAQQIPKP